MSDTIAPLVLLAPFVWAICILALVFRPRPHRPVWTPPPIADPRWALQSLMVKKSTDSWLVPGIPERQYARQRMPTMAETANPLLVPGSRFPGNGLGGGVWVGPSDYRPSLDVLRRTVNAKRADRLRTDTMSPSTGRQDAAVS